MLRSGTARTAKPDGARSQQSLGDLVGVALKDVSQLVRYEIDLAKREFKVDLRRALFGAAFIMFILIVAYPLLLMLLFAYAYGLRSAGLPGGLWGAFLVVAGTIFVFALIAGIAGLIFFKKVTGMKLTRKTVTEDISMLKQLASSDGHGSPDGVAPSGGLASSDGKGTPAVTQGTTGSTDRAPAAVTAK